MKKIVFSNIPMKKELHSLKYKVDGNSTIEYDGKVIFPVNSVLAKRMTKKDKVKVVLLSKIDIVEGNSAINSGKFQQELNNINKNIGAEIEYLTISTPFKESKDVHEKLLRKIIDKLEDEAEIIADVTYGPKSLPIIMFNAMNFAEKFFKAKIKHIVYGKVDFPNGSKLPINPVLYDLTPLYYLNSLTNTMEYKDSKEALKALDLLLSI